MMYLDLIGKLVVIDHFFGDNEEGGTSLDEASLVPEDEVPYPDVTAKGDTETALVGGEGSGVTGATATSLPSQTEQTMNRGRNRDRIAGTKSPPGLIEDQQSGNNWLGQSAGCMLGDRRGQRSGDK